MMSHSPLKHVPLPGAVKYSENGGGKTRQNIIRKAVCLSVCTRLCVTLSKFQCFSPSSSLSSSNSSKIKLHYTPLYSPFGTIEDCLFCLPKEKMANDPWCINQIIPLWPNHSDNVTTKFLNCSQWCI